jgi:hypothetical protein
MQLPVLGYDIMTENNQLDMGFSKKVNSKILHPGFERTKIANKIAKTNAIVLILFLFTMAKLDYESVLPRSRIDRIFKPSILFKKMEFNDLGGLSCTGEFFDASQYIVVCSDQQLSPDNYISIAKLPCLDDGKTAPCFTEWKPTPLAGEDSVYLTEITSYMNFRECNIGEKFVQKKYLSTPGSYCCYSYSKRGGQFFFVFSTKDRTLFLIRKD